MKQGWNKSGHIQGDALESFLGSGGPFWRASGTPRWSCLTCKAVPMHHLRCALTCSLVPDCSTRLEPPDLLMAQKNCSWPFWTLFGHISGQNDWNKSGAHWNKSILTKKSQKHHWLSWKTDFKKATLIRTCEQSPNLQTWPKY